MTEHSIVTGLNLSVLSSEESLVVPTPMSLEMHLKILPRVRKPDAIPVRILEGHSFAMQLKLVLYCMCFIS